MGTLLYRHLVQCLKNHTQLATLTMLGLKNHTRLHPSRGANQMSLKLLLELTSSQFCRSVDIMTPYRTEKVDFSKKNKQIKTRNHQKNKSTGRITRRNKKNKKKTIKQNKNQNCIFRSFQFLPLSCFFLDFGFLVCFF